MDGVGTLWSAWSRGLLLYHKYVFMSGLNKGCVDGWMNGWMNGWMDGFMNEGIDEYNYIYMLFNKER